MGERSGIKGGGGVKFGPDGEGLLAGVLLPLGEGDAMGEILIDGLFEQIVECIEQARCHGGETGIGDALSKRDGGLGMEEMVFSGIPEGKLAVGIASGGPG